MDISRGFLIDVYAEGVGWQFAAFFGFREDANAWLTQSSNECPELTFRLRPAVRLDNGDGTSTGHTLH